MSSKSQVHHVFHIPKTDESTTQKFAQKYRDLRLAALRMSPESFSSTLAIESQYADSVWQGRILRPGFEPFICAMSTNQTQLEPFDPAGDSSTWIAQLTIRGPMLYDDFKLPPESGQLPQTTAEASVEERWQVLGLYVHPDYRGSGLSQKICKESFRYLETERLRPNNTLKQLRLRA